MWAGLTLIELNTELVHSRLSTDAHAALTSLGGSTNNQITALYIFHIYILYIFHIHAALTFLARSTHTCGQLYIFEYLVFPAYQLSELFGLKSWNI